MGIVLPVIGQTSWGDENDLCFQQLQDGGLIANDAGFLSWNYPSYQVSSAQTQTSGSVVMVKLPRFTQAKTINSIWFAVTAAAVTPTAGQCFAALFSSAGTRLGVSADISGQLATVGVIGWNLTAPVVAAANADYYAAVLQNAATPATLGCSSAIDPAIVNAGLTAGSAFFTNGPTAQTSMPASVTMASRTLSSQARWAGVK